MLPMRTVAAAKNISFLLALKKEKKEDIKKYTYSIVVKCAAFIGKFTISMDKNIPTWCGTCRWMC